MKLGLKIIEKQELVSAVIFSPMANNSKIDILMGLKTSLLHP